MPTRNVCGSVRCFTVTDTQQVQGFIHALRGQRTVLPGQVRHACLLIPIHSPDGNVMEEVLVHCPDLQEEIIRTGVITKTRTRAAVSVQDLDNPKNGLVLFPGRIAQRPVQYLLPPSTQLVAGDPALAGNELLVLMHPDPARCIVATTPGGKTAWMFHWGELHCGRFKTQ